MRLLNKLELNAVALLLAHFVANPPRAFSFTTTLSLSLSASLTHSLTLALSVPLSLSL